MDDAILRLQKSGATMDDIVARLRERKVATKEREREAADTISALRAENERLRDSLGWYGRMTVDCRKISSEGNDARRVLDADGGERAARALSGDKSDG